MHCWWIKDYSKRWARSYKILEMIIIQTLVHVEWRLKDILPIWICILNILSLLERLIDFNLFLPCIFWNFKLFKSIFFIFFLAYIKYFFLLLVSQTCNTKIIKYILKPTAQEHFAQDLIYIFFWPIFKLDSPVFSRHEFPLTKSKMIKLIALMN